MVVMLLDLDAVRILDGCEGRETQLLLLQCLRPDGTVSYAPETGKCVGVCS